MTRHGFDYLFGNELNQWNLAITSACRGRRGQKFFRDLIDALDAMPTKVLQAGHLQGLDGRVCALGAVYQHRKIPMPEMFVSLDDPDDMAAKHSRLLDIAKALAAQVQYTNDEEGPDGEGDAMRWIRVRKWAESQLIPEPTGENQ